MVKKLGSLPYPDFYGVSIRDELTPPTRVVKNYELFSRVKFDGEFLDELVSSQPLYLKVPE